jgi:hypothetical protein
MSPVTRREFLRQAALASAAAAAAALIPGISFGRALPGGHPAGGVAWRRAASAAPAAGC